MNGAVGTLASNARTASISIAVDNSKGPFGSIVEIPIILADVGLSHAAAKVFGVRRAMEENCDWVFFLEASDLLFVDVFKLDFPIIESISNKGSSSKVKPINKK